MPGLLFSMAQNFSKTHQELAYLLTSRGLCSSSGVDSSLLIRLISSKLATVNYYRLAAYWYQFRQPTQSGRLSKNLMPGTNWETVWAYYQFDRHLRLLLFDAISRIEIALREKISDLLSARDRTSLNPQNVLKNYARNFKQRRKDKSSRLKCSLFEEMMEKVNGAYNISKGESALHYRNKKIVHAKYLPIWVFLEFATFGNLNTLISVGLKDDDTEKLAISMGFASKSFFVSVISLLHQVRNECAHQGRMWNKKWVQKSQGSKLNPILKKPDRSDWSYLSDPNDDSGWVHTTQPALFRSSDCTAVVLVACRIILQQIAPESHWKERVESLFSEAPMEKIAWEVGFTHKDWITHSLWM